MHPDVLAKNTQLSRERQQASLTRLIGELELDLDPKTIEGYQLSANTKNELVMLWQFTSAIEILAAAIEKLAGQAVSTETEAAPDPDPEAKPASQAASPESTQSIPEVELAGQAVSTETEAKAEPEAAPDPEARPARKAG